jgi:ligand-binding sensor domain-containing protein
MTMCPAHARLDVRLAAALALLAGATPALALDPRAPASSFLRNTFTAEDGLPTNIINTVLQGKDGFLWIGTYFGLTRFDGKHFSNTESSALRVNVRSIAEGPDGDLWLGTQVGVRRMSPRSFDRPGGPQVTVYQLGARADEVVSRVRFTRDGELWAGTARGLYRWNGARFTQVVSGVNVSRIEESLDGHILVPSSQGFLEWDGVRSVDHVEIAGELGLARDQVFQVFQDRQGTKWFSTEHGLFRRVDGSFSRIGPAGASYETFEDQDGNIWISRAGGVFRVRGDALEPVVPDTQCRVLYSDRDGGLWIGTNGAGLVHLNVRTVHMFTKADGLGSDVIMAVLAARSGKLWVGTNCGGIGWFDGSRFHAVRDPDHLIDCAFALVEDGNNDLFVGTYSNGLVRLRDGKFTQYSKGRGLPSDGVTGLLLARDGTLWIGTPHGLTRMRAGEFRTYTTADGLSSNRILTLAESRDGTIWVTTQEGIDRLIGDRFSTIRAAYGPYLMGEYRGKLYANLPPTMNRIDGDRISEPILDLEGWGMAASSNELWFASDDGISRTTEESLDRQEKQRAPLDYAKFTRLDGLQSAGCTSAGGPHLAITPDGRLWVTTEQGLAMIDRPHLPRNAVRPTVYIRDTVVGRRSQHPGERLVLPPGTSHVEVYFDPVELSAPHRIRLQYKLDGVDDGWLDAPATHVAIYSGMSPGSHAFHVRATNRDGAWDLAGMTFPVIQEPFFYQTSVFQALGMVAFLGVLYGLYSYRMRQLAHEFNIRLEERVIERTRIARELHDTLLQSFQALMLRLQVVDDLLPEGKAKSKLEQGLQLGDRAIAEGRTALYDLRSSTAMAADLAIVLRAVGEELNTPDGPAFRFEVVGATRDLHPIIRDEIYRIAREALRNAFGHAEARQIEVELTYGERAFHLRIRDDGKGIPPEVLQEGRRSHYGLCGMRERARQIGGKLEIWSRAGAGTEIELRIARSIAYRTPLARTLWGRFRRKQAET